MKGDRVYAGSDEDARWVPEGAALAAYKEKRKRDEKTPEEPVVSSAVVNVPEPGPDEKVKAVVVDPEKIVVEGDDTEVSEPMVSDEDAPELAALAKEVFYGLTTEYGECPQCKTPSSRIVAVGGDGTVELVK